MQLAVSPKHVILLRRSRGGFRCDLSSAVQSNLLNGRDHSGYPEDFSTAARFFDHYGATKCLAGTSNVICAGLAAQGLEVISVRPTLVMRLGDTPVFRVSPVLQQSGRLTH